jgi:hypothetical protein
MVRPSMYFGRVSSLLQRRNIAGTPGCPTWMLLSCAPDYRWLLDRDDSPWYPTMRLFRQSKTCRWQEIIDRVRRELDMQVASFRPK